MESWVSNQNLKTERLGSDHEPNRTTGIGKAAVRSAVQAFYQELKPENIHAATVTVCGFVKVTEH